MIQHVAISVHMFVLGLYALRSRTVNCEKTTLPSQRTIVYWGNGILAASELSAGITPGCYLEPNTLSAGPTGRCGVTAGVLCFRVLAERDATAAIDQ
jgi:hypothetical protein